MLCSICQVVHELGGFKDEKDHSTPDLLAKAMKENTQLCNQFQACCSEYIAKVNAGRITVRCRGKKRRAVVEGFRGTRQKVVELQKTSGVEVEEPRWP